MQPSVAPTRPTHELGLRARRHPISLGELSKWPQFQSRAGKANRAHTDMHTIGHLRPIGLAVAHDHSGHGRTGDRATKNATVAEQSATVGADRYARADALRVMRPADSPLRAEQTVPDDASASWLSLHLFDSTPSDSYDRSTAMELRQLKHLLAVLEHGSLSRAADALGISHQGLSKSIAGLEEALDVKLLIRGPRGVTASVYGEVLAEHARFIDGEASLAAQAIASLRGGTTGRLVVGAGISAVCSLVPRAAARLFKRRPGTTLTVLTGPYAEFRHAIAEGEIALFVGTVTEEAVDPVVTVEPLFIDHDYIVSRAKHPLLDRGCIGLEDLAAFPWIFSVGTVEFRRRLIQLFEAHGLAPPHSMIESDSLEVTKASLLHTDFLTLLPHQAIANERASGQLAIVEFDSPRWNRPVALCLRKRGGRTTLVDAFAEELRFVARQFEQLPS